MGTWSDEVATGLGSLRSGTVESLGVAENGTLAFRVEGEDPQRAVPGLAVGEAMHDIERFPTFTRRVVQ